MDIKDILEEWKKDCDIDQTQIENEIVRTPKLHAKYLQYYLEKEHELSKMEKLKSQMCWIKRKYFKGYLDKDELEKYGWSQWTELKPSSDGELTKLLDFDADISRITEDISKLKADVKSIDSIMVQIKNRGFALKSLVEYVKFVNGE